jgi:hypothetical protein
LRTDWLLGLVLLLIECVDGVLEVLGVGMGVNLGCCDGRMAEQLLDYADAALAHEPGCEGVAEHMGCEFYMEDVAAVTGADALDVAVGHGEAVVAAWEGVVL